MTTVSVALTTFNGVAHLPGLLTSIAAQSSTPDCLVVSDDLSQDGTRSMLVEECRRLGLPLRLLDPPAQRLGVTANYSRVLNRVTTDVVLLADQDDVWERDKLALCRAALDDGATAVFHDATLIDAFDDPLPGRLWQRVGFTAREQTLAAAGELVKVLLRHQVVTGATFAARTEDLRRFLPMPPGEHDAWLALGLALTGQVMALPQPLIQYRLHGSNLTGLAESSLRARWRGRERSAARARLEAERLRLLLDAVVDDRPQHAHLPLVRAKMAFAVRRQQGGLRRRVIDVARGDYRRFSEAGWRSAVLDSLSGAG